MFLLETLYGAAKKLEEQTVLCMLEVISEVAEVIGGVEGADIRVNWLDRIIREIFRGREHHELVQTSNIQGAVGRNEEANAYH